MNFLHSIVWSGRVELISDVVLFCREAPSTPFLFLPCLGADFQVWWTYHCVWISSQFSEQTWGPRGSRFSLWADIVGSSLLSEKAATALFCTLCSLRDCWTVSPLVRTSRITRKAGLCKFAQHLLVGCSGFWTPFLTKTYMLKLSNNLKNTCNMLVQESLLVSFFPPVSLGRRNYDLPPLDHIK